MEEEMNKTNYLICPGGACPLRLICQRFMAWLWLDNEDEDADEMEPAYHNDACDKYIEKEFYGG